MTHRLNHYHSRAFETLELLPHVVSELSWLLSYFGIPVCFEDCPSSACFPFPSSIWHPSPGLIFVTYFSPFPRLPSGRWIEVLNGSQEGHVRMRAPMGMSLLCDLGQVILPLWVLVFIPHEMKERRRWTPPSLLTSAVSYNSSVTHVSYSANQRGGHSKTILSSRPRLHRHPSLPPHSGIWWLHVA